MERLDKVLAATGRWSRKQAKELVKAGRVTVAGTVARSPEDKVAPGTAVAVDGRTIVTEKYLYLMLHKPAGVVSSTQDPRDKTVLDLLPRDLRGRDLFPVGRLDKDTEGLLLLTNDGAFANGLMHPRGEVEKVYLVWVTGYGPGKEALLGHPITLDGYRIRPPKVTLQRAQGTKARLEITIHEGRNRQIRRMCQQAGLEVTRLKRIREGAISLGTLPPGAWRYLTEEEIRALQSE